MMFPIKMAMFRRKSIIFDDNIQLMLLITTPQTNTDPAMAWRQKTPKAWKVAIPRVMVGGMLESIL